MSKTDFEQVKVKFTAENDPLTNKPISLEFGREDFELSDMPIFKMAAFEKIKTLSKDKSEQNKLSIKYQVLAPGTAMIGVLKNKKKATGDLVSSTIHMGNKMMSEEEQELHYAIISGAVPVP